MRTTNAGINFAETVPDETEDDARTLYCEWDEHGEGFKPFRKSVLESTLLPLIDARLVVNCIGYDYPKKMSARSLMQN